ncbi:hypothetical protein [Streptomyces sp. NBC_00539]|nr:hypothetical protein [Streptomyces sp. NBC_00539]WUC65351.1 hypothetical protein OG861_14445 [Streptomyces sp. NBC_00539]
MTRMTRMAAAPRPHTVHELIAVLPDVHVLRDRCRALAALDVLMGGRSGRYFDYDPGWGPGTEAGLMNNGAGDEYAILFTPDGVFGRGFDHESSMSPYTNEDMALWPGLVDTLPEVFRPLLDEPAFCDDEVRVATVVFWRETHDTAWRAGPVEYAEYADDGTGHLFHVLAAGTPEAYHAFARTTTHGSSIRTRSATSTPCAPSRPRCSKPWPRKRTRSPWRRRWRRRGTPWRAVECDGRRIRALCRVMAVPPE